MKQLRNYISIRTKPSTIKATDKTIKQIVVDELYRLGHDANLNHIDVSEVTNMDSLFSCYGGDLGLKYKDLNPDISKWDVSNVNDMYCMFWGCENFNQDLSSWNVSKVEIMSSMFYRCENFNQDLSRWDVSKTKNMRYMFEYCRNFNKDISGWDVSNVENMYCMFGGCESFNQDISGWDVSKVEQYDYMFDRCPIIEEYKPHFVK